MENLFGPNLKRLREEKGLTQKGLSDATAIPQTTISSWELNQKKAGWDSALQLANFFGVDVSEFSAALDSPPGAPRRGRPPKQFPIIRPFASGKVPILGDVAAGRPTNAGEMGVETLDFKEFEGPNRFVLRVRGESMVDEHITPGDLVLVQSVPESDMADGDVVVAMIDNETTIKKLGISGKGKNKEFKLYPRNAESKMPPILVNNNEAVTISGIAIALVRKLRVIGRRKKS
jgi:SOS-response transcriptional repressor LexA